MSVTLPVRSPLDREKKMLKKETVLSEYKPYRRGKKDQMPKMADVSAGA